MQFDPALSLLALLLSMPPSGTQVPQEARKPEPPPIHGAAGMVVRIDPETGEVGMPEPGFGAAALDPDLDRSMEGLEVVTLPNGSKMVDLKGRFREYMIVRVTPNGRRERLCVQGSELAPALKEGPAPARALEMK